MKAKMIEKLSELYSNLGLPREVIESVAGVAVAGMSADAGDDVIIARANEFGDMLKQFQSHSDKRYNDGVQKGGNKGDKDVPGVSKDDKPAWLQEILDSQKAEVDTLKAEIATLKGANAVKVFDDMVAKAAKELHLSGAVLDLCKKGLSSDMDETAIKNELGAAKKVLIDSGVKIDEQSVSQVSNKEAAEKEANEWLNNFVADHK